MDARHDLIIDTDRDPFDSGKIRGRDEIAKILDNVLNSVDSSLSIAIDSPWGGGKTKFIEMWSQKKGPFLDKVIVNAWQSEFDSVPIACVVKEVVKYAAGEYHDLKDDLYKAYDSFLDLIPVFAPLAKFAGGTAAVAATVATAAVAVAKGRKGDAGPENSIKELQKQFKKIVDIIRPHDTPEDTPKGNSKFVVIIDELDRCKPFFAIEMLEVIKHVFDVEGVAFIFAIDRTQLCHVVRAVYGAGFDAETYLERFFDVTIGLPQGESYSFTADCFDKIFKNDPYFNHLVGYEFTHFCTCVFDSMRANYRRRYQLLLKLKIASKGLSDYTSGQPAALLILIALKEMHQDVYVEFRDLVMADHPNGIPSDKLFARDILHRYKKLWSAESFRFFASFLLAHDSHDLKSDNRFISDKGIQTYYFPAVEKEFKKEGDILISVIRGKIGFKELTNCFLTLEKNSFIV